MKRAFTLIELLVVIAIIAILAAILFPVFAQAKEAAKKTQTLSNFKQTATAFVMYATDNEDLCPTTPSNVTTLGFSVNYAIPADWRPGTSAGSMERASVHWGNSVFPYTKSYALYAAAGMPKDRIATAEQYANPAKPWGSSSLTFNGVLTSWSLSAVQEPSKLPLVWQGLGKREREGFALTHPLIYCDAPAQADGSFAPCRYNPGGPVQPGNSRASGGFQTGRFGVGTVWIYGKGMHEVHTDTSAKFKQVATNTGAGRLSPHDPFGANDAQGNPTTYYGCGTGGFYYWCYFSPDYDFQ